MGDLDGDGDLDIAAPLRDDNLVNWYRNNGGGSFTSIVIDPDPNSPREVKISDLDSDGNLDIISVIANDNDLIWYENINNVFFETLIDGDLATGLSLDAGDLDGDGDIDIVAISFTDNEISIQENDGSQSFTESTLVFLSGTDVKLFDFDLDGDLDIIAVSSITDTISWFENQGTLSFFERVIDTSLESPKNFDVADLDGDGDLDGVSSTSDRNGDIKNVTIRWYENNGFMSFTFKDVISNESYDLTDTSIFADVNNDGNLDILTSHGVGIDFIASYINDGNENFVQNNITQSIDNPERLRFADLNGDGIDDVIYASRTDDESGYYDMSRCETIQSLQFQSCDFPTLFCDNFNYNVPLMSNINNRWLIQLGGGQMDTSFSPIDNKLELSDDRNIFPYHETDAFQVSYRPDSGSKFTKHFLSPIFSSEFVLNFANKTDNQFFYSGFQKQTITAFSIKTEIDESDGNLSGNMNWYYLNETQPSTVWLLLCGNCTSSEDDLFIKINSLFKNRPAFPFNSSVKSDRVNIFVDNLLIGSVPKFLDTRTDYIMQYEFGKSSISNYTIDDYFVMVGTDRETETLDQYFTDFFRNDTKIITEIADAETGDFAVALNTIWDDMGLISVTSKVIAGLFLMLFMALVMFAMSLSTNHPLSAGVLITVELFLMIFLTFIKLLPIWLPFVVVLVASGIGAAVVKAGTAT